METNRRDHTLLLHARCHETPAAASTVDRRCILFSSAVRSRHRVVEVSAGSVGPVCYAQLRSAVPTAKPQEIAQLSLGLWTALGLDDGGDDDAAVDISVRVDQEGSRSCGGDAGSAPVIASSCACASGCVAAVELRFLDRPLPPRAVATGLARVVGKLLQGSTVWDGQRTALRWFGRLERAQFARVQWTAAGDGCCAALGVVTSATRVTLRFSGDAEDATVPPPLTPALVVARLSRDFGGLDAYAQTLLPAVLARLQPAADSSGGGSSDAAVGAILSGPPGVGKTLLATALGVALGVPTTFLSAADVFRTRVGESEAQLTHTFAAASQQAPSLLVVDGIEAIAAARAASADAPHVLEVGVLGTLVACLERLKSAGRRVFVLGTTSRLDALDPAVTSNGRLDLVVRMEPPGERERLAILRHLTKTWAFADLAPELLARLSEATGGFVGADLLSLCQKTLQLCLTDAAASSPSSSSGASPVVQPSHFEHALADTSPSVLQAHRVSQPPPPPSASLQPPSSSSSAFAGVYGMDAAVRTLTVSLLEPLEDCGRFLTFGAAPPKGILLTGAPGAGKSHLAAAVASEVRRRGLASFVAVNCADLLTKVVGDTEQALRALFATARSAAPCVVYFDQIETLAPVRGFDTSTEQTFDRLLSMLLVEMDGFGSSPAKMRGSLQGPEARSAFLKQHVVVLASTTRKELLDPSILRPGRFDVHIHVAFPDERAREQIVLDALATIPLDYSEDAALNEPRAVAAYVAHHSSGKSAGDVRALLREAAMAAMREQLDVARVPIRFLKQAVESGGDVLSQQFGAAAQRKSGAAGGGAARSRVGAVRAARDRRSRR